VESEGRIVLVIPAIDLIQGKCVRLQKGEYTQKTVYSVDPLAQARNLEKLGFKRLHLVDLEGAKEGRGINRKIISRTIQGIGIPVEAGGGLRSQGDLEELFRAGLTFAILGTVVMEEPERVAEWVSHFGPERFIISLDLKAGEMRTRGWIEKSPLQIQDITEMLCSWGISQVICTDIERDGTLTQPGYSTCVMLREALADNISLIAAGGVTAPSHIEELEKLGLQGAIVGRALYEGRYQPEDFISAG
jgi:phosphoribosylformimino-5-aminoimidazole carboxamide ribotide isomerase